VAPAPAPAVADRPAPAPEDPAVADTPAPACTETETLAVAETWTFVRVPLELARTAPAVVLTPAMTLLVATDDSLTLSVETDVAVPTGKAPVVSVAT